MSTPKKEQIPVLSFFTGGGFMDMGFTSAGFNVVWTNEIDNSFSTLYKEGMSSWKRERGLIDGNTDCGISNRSSIKDILPHTIINEAFSGTIPSIFGVIGGPPCQDFSVFGNLNGFQGDRGPLTDAYLYKILELQPAFFVMENVTGLIKIKRHAKHFLALLEAMKDDYLVDWAVLNSLEYGVPQSRERIFIVGINKKKFDVSHFENTTNWFPFAENKKYVNAQIQYEWPEVVKFGSSPAKPDSIPINLCVESCLISAEMERNISNADEYFKLLGDRRKLRSIKEGETNRPSFKRLHRYRYSPTACYGNNEVHLHPYLHRRLSVREALRIQGVEDSYVLTTKGILSKKFKMIGNGVPVPLAEGLAKSLLSFIGSLTHKAKQENG